MGNVAIAFVCRIGLTTSASSSPKSVNAVSKEGIVEQITPTSVSVRVVRSSACAGCGLSGHCNASECRETLISVPVDRCVACSVGDRVRVVTSSSSVKMALALGFAMPLLLMMAVFGVCRAMAGTSEMVAALYSLLVLIPYYILLYLCRNLVGRRIQISIIERL